MRTSSANFTRALIRSTLSDIIRSPVSDIAWSQATLPLHLGGLGLRETFTTAAAAFTASINASKRLGDVAFSCGDLLVSQLGFPGEFYSHSVLQGQLGDAAVEDPSTHSQRSLHGLLDQLAIKYLRASLDVYGRARLTALTGSSDSSSWLKALPIPSLGLSVPPSEFIIATRIWLAVFSCKSCTPLSMWLNHRPQLVGVWQWPSEDQAP